jgi:hypothetical protein
VPFISTLAVNEKTFLAELQAQAKQFQQQLEK